MPAMPTLDLNYYKGVAHAAGAAPGGCGSGTYYSTSDINFKGCNGGGAGVTGTFYTTTNVQFQAGSGGNIINGVVIALGIVDIQGNGGATRNMTVPVPSKAWKEYRNDWANFKTTFDGGAPATYAAAVAADYSTPITTTYAMSGVLVNGIIYSGGNFQDTGSGNSAFYGVAIVGGAPSIGSTSDFYFNPAATTLARTATQAPQRVAWQDVACNWSGANATCP